MRTLVRTVMLIGLLALAGTARAEPLPPPRVLPGPAMGPAGPLPPPLGYHGFGMPHYYRPSAYAVWNHYEPIPNQGGFRARVQYLPHTAFYTANGKLYPWAAVHPSYVSPWAPDTVGSVGGW